jgi:hypothetical protein
MDLLWITHTHTMEHHVIRVDGWLPLPSYATDGLPYVCTPEVAPRKHGNLLTRSQKTDAWTCSGLKD